MGWLEAWGEASRTALGFFWKAGWAFVLGYAVSAMIQAFVPKARLTRHMGGPGLKSVSLATAFGAASSSCSFAALAAARSLVLKGAHFAAAVAFMFASANLVIELGVLILIFLGWQFLAAEIVGSLLLIAISSVLIRLTYPRAWMKAARERVEKGAPPEQDDFDWKKRIRSRAGWRLVGHRFVSDWKMVWEEILIGFTVAGFVAVLVPAWVWSRISSPRSRPRGSRAAGVMVGLQGAATRPPSVLSPGPRPARPLGGVLRREQVSCLRWPGGRAPAQQVRTTVRKTRRCSWGAAEGGGRTLRCRLA